jgi:hypothetical protein
MKQILKALRVLSFQIYGNVFVQCAKGMQELMDCNRLSTGLPANFIAATKIMAPIFEGKVQCHYRWCIDVPHKGSGALVPDLRYWPVVSWVISISYLYARTNAVVAGFPILCMQKVYAIVLDMITDGGANPAQFIGKGCR